MIQSGDDVTVDVSSLPIAVGMERGACIALIGGGGKTSLMLALATHAVAGGLTVAITTTTRIWPPAGIPLILHSGSPDFELDIRRRLAENPCIAIGTALSADGKVIGLNRADLCRLRLIGVVDAIVCEADGSAGRPLKVHGEHEPLVPACATCVVAVAGMDALGVAAGPEVVHRFEEYVRLFSDGSHEPVTPRRFADLLVRATCKISGSPRILYALNKVDNVEARRAAAAVEAELRALRPGEPVIMTAWGHVVARSGPMLPPQTLHASI